MMINALGSTQSKQTLKNFFSGRAYDPTLVFLNMFFETAVTAAVSYFLEEELEHG